MISLPSEDLPRSAEMEAIVEEQADREGTMAADLARTNNEGCWKGSATQ
ncbi:hypothetical protein A2U01_0018130 [Trifolium medium]|uniref:Uncharacterized protein n=1 Tax=Trifolium medium TaxID=97028 RepID=A0A392NBA4_9FABA|nr:hypothetical protein [Trifolium medium]